MKIAKRKKCNRKLKDNTICSYCYKRAKLFNTKKDDRDLL